VRLNECLISLKYISPVISLDKEEHEFEVLDGFKGEKTPH